MEGRTSVSQSVSHVREGERMRVRAGGSEMRNATFSLARCALDPLSAAAAATARISLNIPSPSLRSPSLPSSPRPCLTLARRRPPSGSEQKQGFPTALPFLKDLDVTIRIRGSQQFPFLAKSRISRFLRWSLGSPAPTSASFSAEFIICYVPEESRNPAENICCAFTVREPKQN